MANWKKVDADQLDADLTSVADAIRERSGTADPLNFPDGFKSAVEGIVDYGERMADGSITHFKNKNIQMLRTSCFANTSLRRIDTPNVNTINPYAFQNCGNLISVDCPLTYIKGNAFMNAGSLCALVIRSDTIATLENTSAFSNTNIKNGGVGFVYVPRALLSDTDETKDYRRATNWSTISSQFRAIEDFSIDGTATGEVIVWRSGIPLGNGTIANNTTRITTRDFAPNTIKKVVANSGYEILVACYDENGNNLSESYWTGNGVSSSPQWYTSLDLDDVFKHYRNIRLCLRRTNGTTMTESDAKNITYTRRTEV